MSKLLIFPTDTVYGIGTSVFDAKNIEKIYEIKHRPHNKPLAVLCANLKQIEEIAYLNDFARALVQNLMPGALTIIVPAKECIKASMNIDMVGVRIPNSLVALKILQENGPMATTSVNDSGSAAMNEYLSIKEKYNDVVDYIYEPSEMSSSVASTVVMINNDSISLIREGEIKLNDILKYKP